MSKRKRIDLIVAGLTPDQQVALALLCGKAGGIGTGGAAGSGNGR